MNASLDKKQRSWALLIFLIASVVIIIAAGLKAPIQWSWPIIAVFMLLMFAAIGKCVKDKYAGVLINERKMMSLSRFQMTLWSLIVLSAYAAIGMARARDGLGTGALDIAVPPEVWMLLGISSAALVGSPLLASNKMKKEPIIDPNDPSPKKEREGMGILSVKSNAKYASFSDLFKGEEIKNWNDVDLAKLQMFFFTIIVAIVYCIELYQMIAYGDLSENLSLPTIDQGMLTLMGISNTAYLGHKGIDQTPAKPK